MRFWDPVRKVMPHRNRPKCRLAGEVFFIFWGNHSGGPKSSKFGALGRPKGRDRQKGCWRHGWFILAYARVNGTSTLASASLGLLPELATKFPWLPRHQLEIINYDICLCAWAPWARNTRCFTPKSCQNVPKAVKMCLYGSGELYKSIIVPECSQSYQNLFA